MAHDGIILHHYDASPFSQKVRAVLGLKKLPWQSVVTPNMLPKPDLVLLTGGYRRAPVMQIGADVFIDSPLIVAEIERRHPGHAGAADAALHAWADRAFFQTTVTLLFGTIGDRIDPRFAADRAALSGRAFDVAGMKAAAVPARSAWRVHAAGIEAGLAATDAPFLAGAAPGIADAAAQMNLWFLANTLRDMAAALIGELPRTRAWFAAMQSIGEGTRTEMTGGDALTIARDATPAAAPAHDEADPLGLSPGDAVTVAADDYGRDPIAGTLVALTRERVTIAREMPDLGILHLHAPRIGYAVARA